MGKYIIKRILSGIVTILILITACFFLMHAIPGSPFSKGEQGVPEAVMQRLNEKYGLDQPLHVQYFRYLDQLHIGDRVSVTNLWETLNYRVCEIRIIDPSDVEEILIQPGRELLTLLTCHPYASGGRQRYVVYCERSELTTFPTS